MNVDAVGVCKIRRDAYKNDNDIKPEKWEFPMSGGSTGHLTKHLAKHKREFADYNRLCVEKDSAKKAVVIPGQLTISQMNAEKKSDLCF